MSYHELSVEERATIQIGRAQGLSLRRIAGLIKRSPSTISRELRRNRGACGGYSAHTAQQQMSRRRQVCRPQRKLLPGSERFELVAHMLRERLSPEPAGRIPAVRLNQLLRIHLRFRWRGKLQNISQCGEKEKSAGTI